ncbi:MAG: ATP-binding protein [Clostridia bacterium]|nr:ATP-binding protein [Clostridia bacterium]
MKKRIFRYMLLLTLLCLFLLGALVSMLFYSAAEQWAKRDVRDKAILLQNLSPDVFTEGGYAGGDRLTLIAPDGLVRYDSAASDPPDNHLDRPEVQAAFRTGFGEATRFSQTMGASAYYYAVRLPGGDVLRVSRPIASTQGVLWHALPVMAVTLLAVYSLGNVLAARLTRAIINPIQAMPPVLEEDTPVYDELSPLVHTIVQQRKRIESGEQDLRERAKMLEDITENMREGIVLLDRQGIVVQANASALALLGATAESVGKHLLVLTRDLAIVDHAKSALAGERSDCVLAIGDRHIQVYCSPSLNSGAMLLFMDITEKVQAEQTRMAFSANVSHELKTPLTSICGYAEILSSGAAAPEEAQHFADILHKEAKRLVTLVEDIMQLSKLDESTPSTLDRDDVNVFALAEEAVAAARAKADAKQVRLALHGESCFLRANRAMIHELLYNLVDNAVKYNKPHGTVTVEIIRQAGQALITVRDTGIGIPKALQERVFERFFRADPSRSKETEGTGLGLAIVKHIALAHGGEVALESREGEGTTLRVTLPGCV